MPVHHLLEQILNEYIVAVGIQSVQPLSQSVNSLGTAVTGRALNRYNAWTAIRKGASQRVFSPPWDVTLRANWHHNLPGKAGRLEHAQQMAGHESARTTKLSIGQRTKLH